MKFLNKLFTLGIIILISILFLGWRANIKKIESNVDEVGSICKNYPMSIQMYYYVVRYAEEYNIPYNIAFGVARYESGYEGPFHWKYDPKQTSFAKAYGAMQIQVPTANDFTEEKVSHKDLLNDLELNVKTSMKILSHLKKRHKSWLLALGAYNTGKPVINQYALNIVNYKTDKMF